MLKLKTSKELLRLINKQYPTFPFSMRNFENERCRFGVGELVKHDMVQPYPVLSEKNGQFVAQFKFTVVIGPNTTIQITGLPLDMSAVHPSKQIKDQELNGLLSMKYDGHLPAIYDMVELPKFDPSLMEEKKSDSNGPRKKQVNKNKGKGGGKGGNSRFKKGQNKKSNKRGGKGKGRGRK